MGKCVSGEHLLKVNMGVKLERTLVPDGFMTRHIPTVASEATFAPGVAHRTAQLSAQYSPGFLKTGG